MELSNIRIVTPFASVGQDATNYSNKTCSELVAICKEKRLKGYSGKKKEELVKLIVESYTSSPIIPLVPLVHDDILPSGEKKEDLLPLKMIDLFAGTGAFTYAFEQTGKVSCVFANDMVKWSKKIYDENHEHKLTLQDLNTIKVEDIPKHDILTGGFPCQPFSIAGKQMGFDDSRSNVFWKILEIVDYHNPRAIVLENVKNLVGHDEGRTFSTILENLTKRGYHIKYKVLNTSTITPIPQHRERIYIVCLKDKDVMDRFSLDFPSVEKKSISEMLTTEDVDSKYYYTDKSSTWPLVSQAVVKHDTIYQYRRVYVRENKSNECPTLTANMGGGGHNVPLVCDTKGIRKLTPRECFNFQGFPSSYRLPKISDTELYKLAGNAVSVPVVKLIADRLMSLLVE